VAARPSRKRAGPRPGSLPIAAARGGASTSAIPLKPQPLPRAGPTRLVGRRADVVAGGGGERRLADWPISGPGGGPTTSFKINQSSTIDRGNEIAAGIRKGPEIGLVRRIAGPALPGTPFGRTTFAHLARADAAGGASAVKPGAGQGQKVWPPISRPWLGGRQPRLSWRAGSRGRGLGPTNGGRDRRAGRKVGYSGRSAYERRGAPGAQPTFSSGYQGTPRLGRSPTPRLRRPRHALPATCR